MVTLDNKEAVVESGDQVPFKTESADSGPKVEFKDAMITLKVTPHISPDDYVLLEVDARKAEVDFSRTVDGNPTITNRQTRTSVLVKDGATVVMGGLFKQQTVESQEGLPGLSKIPYLGWLFKTRQTRNDNEDLLFFITPRIMRARQELAHSLVSSMGRAAARGTGEFSPARHAKLSIVRASEATWPAMIDACIVCGRRQ